MNQPGNEKQESRTDQDDDLDLDLDLELDDLDLDLDEGTPDTGAGADAAPEAAADPAPLLQPDDEPVPDTDLSLHRDEPPVGVADKDVADAAAATTSGAAAAGAAGLVAEPSAAPETEPAPAALSTAAATDTAAEAGVEGQWVWQYAAPPPPPAFSAVFFSGTALKEKYRFFACGVLATLGCLLPWQAGVVGVEGTVPGFMVPMGAVCLALSLWLVWGACTSIYARKPMILPAFLMFIPAEVTWVRLLDAWGAADGSLGLADQVNQVLYTMGTGVLLTLVGSTIVAVQFVLTLGKVLGSKKEPATGRAAKVKQEKPAKAKREKPVKVKKEKPAKEKGAAKGDDAKSEDAKGKVGKGRRGRRH